MEIEWSRRASADIRDIRAYIAKDSPAYARRFVEGLVTRVERLQDFPAMGRAVPEAAGRSDVRELIHRGYRIVYLAQPDKVSIVSVIHHGRDLEGMASKPWDSQQ